MLVDILRRKSSSVLSARDTARVADVAKLMVANKVGSVAITDASGAIVGIFEEKSVVEGVVASGAAFLEQPVRQHCASPAPSCTISDSVSRVMRRMTEDRVRHLLVMDGKEVAGLVSIGDVVKARMRNADLEALVLRDLAQAKVLAAH